MEVNGIPKMSMENSETGCCPKFDPTPWDDKGFTFQDKLFAKANTINFLHIPLNMGLMMTKTWKAIKDTDAIADEFIILSYDPSLWKGEHYFAVTKKVPEMEMVRFSGNYLSKVFEGPYKDAGKWMKEMTKFVQEKGKNLKKLYFFYTTCPKCAKHYGKNYVVGFAEI